MPRKKPLALIQQSTAAAPVNCKPPADEQSTPAMDKRKTKKKTAAASGTNQKPVPAIITDSHVQQIPSSGSGDQPSIEKSFPMFRFEKLELHQRWFVNMDKLYCDGQEFSFEEIRAQKWMAKQEREAEKAKSLRMEQELRELKQLVKQLQASMGKNPVTPLNPLNTPPSNKVRNPDTQIAVQAVAGIAPVNDFVIYEDETTNIVPILKKAQPQPVPAFEIYTDPTDQITAPIVKGPTNGLKKKPLVAVAAPSFEIYTDPTDQITAPVPNGVAGRKQAPAASFEIFQDEPTDQVPVVRTKQPEKNGLKKKVLQEISPKVVQKEEDEPQQVDHEEQEELEDRMDTFCDFSINPVGHPATGNGSGNQNLSSFTFVLPSETEFLSKAISSSTPAAPGNKKHVSRLPVVSAKQSAPQPPPPPPVHVPEKTELLLTGKLDTIVETSREYKSCSSSSGSSGAHTTRGMTISQRTRYLSGPGYEPGIIPDPFDPKLIQSLMDELEEPIDRRKGFKYINKNLPKIRESMTKLPLGQTGDQYIVQELRDEGAYAKVYTAQIEMGDDGMMDGYSSSNNNTAISDIHFNKFYALKICSPANMWEFYIVDELHKRLSRKQGIDIELSVQMGNPAVLYQDASVLVDEYCPNGTLMKLVNLYKKSKKPFPKSMVAYFALELMLVINAVHDCDIIHADVKPDNVLILNFPTREEVISVIRRTSSIKLIDFGRGIDLSFFPKDTQFTHVIETRGSACPEMRDGRAWSHQVDWFGFLDCLHVMIFQEYIDISRDAGTGDWDINKKVNNRQHLKSIWEPLFHNFLNLSSSSPAASDGNNNKKSRQEVVAESITLLTKYAQDHVDDIYKESMILETFISG